MTLPFDITAFPLPNGTLIEASAGTGKTHAVAAYVTKALATNEDLRIGEILVTTYTRNAAAELRERIRTRLVVTARLLRGQDPPAGYKLDELDADLLAEEAGRCDKARRLERAAAEFDTATIGTIHAVCARVLRLAGVEATETGDEELRDRVLDEVVNDAIVTEAIAGRQWEEQRLRDLVRLRMADPFIEMTYDPGECPAELQGLLGHLPQLITTCAERARRRMRASPSFDELLVRAWEEVTDQPTDSPADRSRKTAFVAALHDKFKLAIVDEAQDTNRLQWEFFHAVFPPTGANRLVAVGDPKQAIYGFRGADVTAYVHHAQDGVPPEQGLPPRRTLSVNRRSDGPLLAGLNAVLAGATFGNDIPYREVTAAPGREAAQVVGLRPVEFLDVAALSLVEAATRKVHELLTGPHFKPAAARPFAPREICVLVRTNAIGSAIAKRLGSLRIPAVTEGTASVMDGQMAADLLSLLEAMERPSHAGRARRAAATVFFGEPIENVARLGEPREQEIHGTIAALHAVVQRRGIAALAARIMADPEMVRRIATGAGGDRRIVDFSHVVELLNDATAGRGCHAREVLEHFAALAAQDKKAELVSRRIESDAEAVTIMTVHAAKGLQFPCVVVVDAWSPKASAGRPEVFHRDGTRLMDIGQAIPNGDIGRTAKDAARTAENEELRRLIYVAVTRPEHHICILRTAAWEESLLRVVLRQAPGDAPSIPPEQAEMLAVRSAADLPAPTPWMQPPAADTIAVAPAPPPVRQTYQRTSYTAIAKAAARMAAPGFEAEGHGHDEQLADMAAASPTDAEPPAAATPDVSGFTIHTLPAGTALGSIAHDIFEKLVLGPDVPEAAVRAEVARVVREVATARFLRDHLDAFAAMIADALLTPFGGPPGAAFRDLRFADFAPCDRLAEMGFEMSLPTLTAGVKARHVGLILEQFIGPGGDPLAAYAERLAGAAFDVPLAGLINGSIDAVLRLPGSPADSPRLLIADYKTNRLHERDAASPLEAYAPARLVAAMAGHHYPLQALVYGTAIWRMLRWRLGPQHPADWDPGECIAGIVYGFVRGMKGPTTPVDAAGGRYGVFAWQPPHGLWRRLSDLFAGDLTGVR
jgi:exodeoxyribonuclease V beta subunit